MQIEAMLNEICKISTLDATKALSKMMHTPVGIKIDSIEINHINNIIKLIKPDETAVNQFLTIKGRIPGAAFLIYPEKTALALCDILLNRPNGGTKALSDIEISALSEAANIIIGHFLTSFASSLQIDMLIHRTATFDCAPFSIIYEQIQKRLSTDVDKPFLKISFSFEHLNMMGNITIVFDQKTIHHILKELLREGVK